MALEIRDLRSHLRHLRRRRIRPRGGDAAIGDGVDGGEQGGGGDDNGDRSDRSGEAAVAAVEEAAAEGEKAEGEEDADEEEESPIRGRGRERRHRHGSVESISLSLSSRALRSEAPVALSGTPKAHTGPQGWRKQRFMRRGPAVCSAADLGLWAPLKWAHKVVGQHKRDSGWARVLCSSFVRKFYYSFFFLF